MVAEAGYRAGDEFIAQGTRVMRTDGAANRDERHCQDPDRFLADRMKLQARPAPLAA